MTAEQIKKLAAAGLTVEQIAAVTEIMEPREGHLGGMWGVMKQPRMPSERNWPGKHLGLPEDHLVHLTPPDPNPPEDPFYVKVKGATVRVEHVSESNTHIIAGETTDGTKFINCPNCGYLEISKTFP